jgi:hypothetical protein
MDVRPLLFACVALQGASAFAAASATALDDRSVALDPRADAGVVRAEGAPHPRTLAARAAESMTVKDFGATCDATWGGGSDVLAGYAPGSLWRGSNGAGPPHDDAPAFQAAIAWAQSTGRKLRQVSGNCYIGSGLTIRGPLTWEGDTSAGDWAARGYEASGGKGAQIVTDRAIVMLTIELTNSQDGATLRDIRFRGTKATRGAIWVKKGFNVRMESVRIAQMWDGYGIKVGSPDQDVFWIWIVNPKIDRCMDGIVLEGRYVGNVRLDGGVLEGTHTIDWSGKPPATLIPRRGTGFKIVVGTDGAFNRVRDTNIQAFSVGALLGGADNDITAYFEDLDVGVDVRKRRNKIHHSFFVGSPGLRTFSNPIVLSRASPAGTEGTAIEQNQYLNIERTGKFLDENSEYDGNVFINENYWTSNGPPAAGRLNTQGVLSVGRSGVALDDTVAGDAALGHAHGLLGFNVKSKPDASALVVYGTRGRNGGAAIVGKDGELDFAVIPSTGGSDRTISRAELAAQRSMRLTSNRNLVVAADGAEDNRRGRIQTDGNVVPSRDNAGGSLGTDSHRWSELHVAGTGSIGTLALGASERTIRYAASAPTGNCVVGSIVFSTAPVPGGKLGWACTVIEGRGSWKTFGAIDP